MMSERFAIRTEALTKIYRQGKKNQVLAVDHVDLAVEPGQVFGFLGPNGAGKTTTLKMACGLVKPSSGRAWIGGHDVWQRRVAATSQIGAVLEGARNTHWDLPAWDNILWFGLMHGLSGKRLRLRAEELLRRVELWDRRKDLVREFSRGMKQKLSVACALVADPPILLLDEPTLGLDVQAARTVREMISRLSEDDGRTIVLTTHQMDLAEELCDRVAIISQGRIIANRPVGELLGLFRQEHYEIAVDGHWPDLRAPAEFGLTVDTRNGLTIFRGAIADKDHLHGVLCWLHGEGAPLTSVNRKDPDLEEVFVKLVEESRSTAAGGER